MSNNWGRLRHQKYSIGFLFDCYHRLRNKRKFHLALNNKIRLSHGAHDTDMMNLTGSQLYADQACADENLDLMNDAYGSPVLKL